MAKDVGYSGPGAFEGSLGCGKYSRAQFILKLTVSKPPNFRMGFRGPIKEHLRKCPLCRKDTKQLKLEIRQKLISSFNKSIRMFLAEQAAKEARSKFALVVNND